MDESEQAAAFGNVRPWGGGLGCQHKRGVVPFGCQHGLWQTLTSCLVTSCEVLDLRVLMTPLALGAGHNLLEMEPEVV